MASGTVGYTDTRGNRDYASMIASQIGRRVKEASDMASDERAFASKQAEAGGTSLEEAGIGKGYFFKRALGSRFGGDRIARTRGRLGAQGAGKNPAASYKQRFRGGFDYNVTNQAITDVAPLSNALASGLRGVQGGLDQVSSAIQRQDKTLNSLSRSQADMAKAIMFNGYLFQMFASEQRRERERSSARREERSIEGGGDIPTSSRQMINVTPPGGDGGFGSRRQEADFGDVARRGVKRLLPRSTKTAKNATTAAKALNAASKTKDASKIANMTYKSRSMLRPVTKGLTNMATKMPGMSAAKQLFKGTEQLTKSKGVISQLLDGANTATKIKSFTKQLATIGKGGEIPSKILNATVTQGDDAAGILVKQFGRGKKIKKQLADTAVDIAGSSKNGINLVTSSDSIKDAIKATDAATNGLTSSRIIAAATDAGAGRKILKKFLGVAKPKGLMRGSKLTRMLIKNPAGKMFLKKLPLIGAVAGTIFAAQRLMEGDYLGASLELASGVLGAAGAGPASLGVDGLLLARDFGAVPFDKGAVIKARRGKGVYSVRNGVPAVIGEGGHDEGILPLTRKTYLNIGLGFMDAIKEKKSDYAKITGMGVFSGIGNARSGGLFNGIGESVGNTLTNTKDIVGSVLQKINPANLFKPDANGQNFFQRIGSGVTNWWNKGKKPNEGKMNWKELISDDWNQRQRTQGAGKGGWNPFRGMPGYGTVKNFLTGKPGNEIAGGFQTGPTPLIRQSVLRGAGLLMNPKAAILAALMKPTALGDGTLTGNTEYLNSLGIDTSNLTNSGGGMTAATVINNNTYNNYNGGSGDTSGNETLGQGFSSDFSKFVEQYSIASK